MTEKICTNCGSKNNSSSSNCYWCGSKLDDDRESRKKRIDKIWGRRK